jgi:YfiH family protein
MNAAVFLRSTALPNEGFAHAFFTRQGGASRGVYESLNGGVGSKDDPACVAENRARMAQALGVPPDHLLVPYQIHSPDVLYVREPWAPDARPRVDGLVTDRPGIALGVTGADCGMILFAEPEAMVIGACHAGWKGAFTGVLEATVQAMEALGADRRDITAVLGPTIGAASYEVGPEFVARFIEAGAHNERYFTPSVRADHAMFNLTGFIAMRLQGAGVGRFEDMRLDTYADPARFFSYRRTTHLGEPDYGRLVSAIALV